MLNPIQLDAYLHRLAFQGELKSDLATLTALHQAHLQRIAFENLDIRLGKKLDLSEEALVNKQLQQGRGGICYELNQAFALLLETLGFAVSRLSARVHNGQDYGQEFDHMLLLVQLDGQDYLADVGFGDSFRTPMQLGSGTFVELGVHYCLVEDGEAHFVLIQGKDGCSGQPQYRFRLKAYSIGDFLGMFKYHQTSPLSHFTQKTICSIATLSGRITLSGDNRIMTDAEGRHVYPIRSEKEYRALLFEHFGMRLPEDADIGRLLSK